MAEQEDDDQEPEVVLVPVDEPEPLTGRHREFVWADPLAGQHWDRRNWRRS